MASPAPAGGGRKILGMRPRTAILAAVTITGGALLLFWLRNRGKPPGASSSSASASAYTDASQLDYLQTELDELLQDQNPGTTGSSTGSSTGTAVEPSPPVTTKVAPPPAGGTTTKTPAKTAAPAMPANVRASKVTANGFTLSWGKAPNAASYRVRVTYQGKLVGSAHTTSGTSLAVSGLTPDRTYTAHVASIGPGGTSAETNGPTVKTAR